jgi:hypothetical protein
MPALRARQTPGRPAVAELNLECGTLPASADHRTVVARLFETWAPEGSLQNHLRDLKCHLARESTHGNERTLRLAGHLRHRQPTSARSPAPVPGQAGHADQYSVFHFEGSPGEMGRPSRKSKPISTQKQTTFAPTPCQQSFPSTHTEKERASRALPLLSSAAICRKLPKQPRQVIRSSHATPQISPQQSTHPHRSECGALFNNLNSFTLFKIAVRTDALI